MALSNAAKAGASIFAGATQFGVFLIVAEALYPGYNVSANYVSDLGATRVADGTYLINQPTATIFDASVALLGLLSILGAFYFRRAFHWTPGAVMIALVGVGTLGVGLFPETTGVVHSIFSLIAFLFAGLSALVVARFQKKPMFYFSIILGVATLLSLLLYVGDLDLGLGVGGMERMIVYPALLWAIGFGGHLMGMEDPPST
ncbi:MAG: DUF998 domain-containing protein [Thaumarchaeota archaeon]|nr:DUF998 domain-containing protein [Nitrososphaerota archaeon]